MSHSADITVDELKRQMARTGATVAYVRRKRSPRFSAAWWLEAAEEVRREGAVAGFFVEDIVAEYAAQAVAAALEGR